MTREKSPNVVRVDPKTEVEVLAAFFAAESAKDLAQRLDMLSKAVDQHLAGKLSREGLLAVNRAAVRFP